MSARRLPNRDVDAVTLDLHCLDLAVGRVLPPLLLGRFDLVVLHRWAKVRAWVSSAQEGDWVMDLESMAMATDYLVSLVTGECSLQERLDP